MFLGKEKSGLAATHATGRGNCCKAPWPIFLWSSLVALCFSPKFLVALDNASSEEAAGHVVRNIDGPGKDTGDLQATHASNGKEEDFHVANASNCTPPMPFRSGNVTMKAAMIPVERSALYRYLTCISRKCEDISDAMLVTLWKGSPGVLSTCDEAGKVFACHGNIFRCFHRDSRVCSNNT